MQQPIMITVAEQPVDETTVAEVLLGAMGLTGVLILMALVLGLVLGGLIVGYKRYRERGRTDGPRAGADSDAIHISPYS